MFRRDSTIGPARFAPGVRRRVGAWIGFAATLALATMGCGTTRKTDTLRTATEQLVLSTAIDRAVNNIDFSSLSGRPVFLDTQYLAGTTDEKYIISSLRQHLVAFGCELKSKGDDAEYIVEARSGGVGTDRQELLMGIPQVNVPNVAALPGVGGFAAIPEIALAKTTHQIAVAKIAVFAYHRESGLAVWQSGAFPAVANSRDSWILSAGPFQRGTVYEGTRFAGNRLMLTQERPRDVGGRPPVPVTAEAVYPDRPQFAKGKAGAKEAAATVAAAPPAGPNAASSPAAAPTGQGSSTADASASKSSVVNASVARPSKGPAEPGPPVAPRIVRLPTVERKDRPDLYVEESSGGSQRTADGRASPSDRVAPDRQGDGFGEPDENQDDSGAFDIFDPRTWLR